VVRVVVEHVDTAAPHKIVAPPEKEKWGSLRSLDKVLATVTNGLALPLNFLPVRVCMWRRSRRQPVLF
jgi:hypothetical protein